MLVGRSRLQRAVLGGGWTTFHDTATIWLRQSSPRSEDLQPSRPVGAATPAWRGQSCCGDVRCKRIGLVVCERVPTLRAAERPYRPQIAAFSFLFFCKAKMERSAGRRAEERSDVARSEATTPTVAKQNQSEVPLWSFVLLHSPTRTKTTACLWGDGTMS